MSENTNCLCGKCRGFLQFQHGVGWVCRNCHPDNPKPEPRRIIQISSCGVENTASTQCSWVTTALCNDGSAWFSRSTDDAWYLFPEIPQPEECE